MLTFANYLTQSEAEAAVGVSAARKPDTGWMKSLIRVSAVNPHNNPLKF